MKLQASPMTTRDSILQNNVKRQLYLSIYGLYGQI